MNGLNRRHNVKTVVSRSLSTAVLFPFQNGMKLSKSFFKNAFMIKRSAIHWPEIWMTPDRKYTDGTDWETIWEKTAAHKTLRDAAELGAIVRFAPSKGDSKEKESLKASNPRAGTNWAFWPFPKAASVDADVRTACQHTRQPMTSRARESPV